MTIFSSLVGFKGDVDIPVQTIFYNNDTYNKTKVVKKSKKVIRFKRI